MELLHLGLFINYVTLKGGGGISQCDDVYIKHTSVWDIVRRVGRGGGGGGGGHNGQ